MIKDIIKNLKPSSTLLINEKSNKLESEGKKIFKFGFGQSPFKVPQDIVNELKNNAHQNKYLPMQGLEELRKSIAKYISKKKNYEYSSNNVIVGPGSKELIFQTQLVLDCDVLLPSPSWVSYEPQAQILNKKIHLETSGTQPLSGSFDWICFSPKKFKKPLDIFYKISDELKIVVCNRLDFKWAESHAQLLKKNSSLFLQPEWSVEKKVNPLIFDYIKENPKWKLSLQIHKFLGVD